jgi:hypothetical protein
MMEFLTKHADEFIYGALVAVVAWFVLNMVGRPILALRDKRVKALQIADRYAYFGPTGSEERAREVRRELLDVASELRAQTRSHNWLVRCYCRLLRYDIEEAALALRGLAEMAGGNYAQEVCANNLNHVHISLRAHHHLSPETLRKHQEIVASESSEKEPPAA